MNISTPFKKFLPLFVLVLGVITQLNAQNDPLIFNNGSVFFINGGVNDSAVVWVDGGVTNNDNLMINKGKFFIHGDFINNDKSGGPGTGFPPVSPNNGLFEVDGNWENNGEFFAGSGTVRFMESDTILGDSVTQFNNAELVGDIIRVQFNVNSEISETGKLKLDSGEWATDFDTLFVLNSGTGAIGRADCDTCGFVSSLEHGNLSRVTSQNVDYLFPVGSSIDAPTDPNNFKRYRPIHIKPVTSADDAFSVRFVNQDPTPYGLPKTETDTSICYVNPWWYHRINQVGGANISADLNAFANPAEGDENYNTLANWSATTAQWENLNNASSGIVDIWNAVERTDWNDFQTGFPEDAYIMAFNVPSEPVVGGDTALCADVESVYTVPENGSDYDFQIIGGIIVDSTDYSVTVIWDNDSINSVVGTLQIVETIPNNINGGCASIRNNLDVEVYALPQASFGISLDTNLSGGIFVHDIIAFLDSSVNTTEWNWDFADGTTSTDSLPFHSYYDVGTYDVTLVVRSGLECLDTLVYPIEVVEGLIVPNVFTPNGDGWNDVFDIRTSDVAVFNLEIYNRWGNVVYENASPLISWDGTTTSGVEASSGTYFYVISKAEMNSGNALDNELPNYNFKETGWIQLIR